MKLARKTVSGTAPKRIAIMAAYSGWNIGDGAIQDTVLRNLGRDASVELYGVTLYPADTEDRHGIPSVPITGLGIPYFSDRDMLFATELLPSQNAPVATPEDAASNGGGAQPELSPWQQAAERLREVKNVPYLGRALRLAVFRIRDVGALATEGRKLVSAYRFARKLDLLILSGSGQLNEEWGGPWGLPYAIFRWAMLAKLAGTPFAVASTGAGMLESRLTRWFLKNALQTACYRSYRDEGTKALLTDWEFTRNDPIVRDMAFRLDPTPYLSARRKSGAQRVVAVSPINFGNPQYWPTPDPPAYHAYVKGLTELVHWLLEERGYRVLLYKTSSGDRVVMQDLWTGLRERFGGNCPEAVQEVEALRYQELLEQIGTADLVVGSRLHSIVLPHVLGKPTMGISWDRKIEAHMNDFEQTQYMVDIRSTKFETLRATFERLERDATQVRETLRRHSERCKADLDRQFETLLRIAAHE